MKQQIFYCKNCDLFTLKNKCPRCNEKPENPRPAKYSLEDKWGAYRRIAKKSTS